MKKIINIGKYSKEDNLKLNRKVSREIALENSTGWVATHKVHTSEKDYKRNPKHKQKWFDYL